MILQRQRAVMVDLAIGLGIPVLQMVLRKYIHAFAFSVMTYYG